MERTSTFGLLLPPVVVVVVAITNYSRILPDVVSRVGRECDSPQSAWTGLEQALCFFSAFFTDCFRTKFGFTFMASLLSFIAVLLTLSYVEAVRLFNQPSRIIRTPIVTWTMVNAITGSIAIPGLLAATVKRRNDGLKKRKMTRQQGQNNRDRPGCTDPVSVTPEDRHIRSSQETYAIPVAVALGFIFPSIVLMARPTLFVVGLWNLFPLFVSLIRIGLLKVIRQSHGQSPSTSHYCESNMASCIRLYAVPVGISFLSHIYLIYTLAMAPGRDFPLSPALKLMICNITSIAVIMLYWLSIESSLKVIFTTLIYSIIAGPGVGLACGWILKERVIVDDAFRKARQPKRVTPEAESLLQESR
jgi:hypothetical protein